MQDLRQEAEIRKKQTSLVGTSRAKSLNYSKNIPAFDSSHIPQRAAKIKSDIKLSILPDILGTKKPQWNPTVLLDRTKEYHQQVSTNQTHFEIRKGLRDEANPPMRDNKIYEGVNTRNSFAGWDTSVQFSLLEHKNNHIQVNKEARYKSASRNRELLKDKPYTKPYDRQIQILNQSRELKIQEKDLKTEIMQKVAHENPDISKEKSVAVVHKLVQDKKLKDGQESFYGVKEESFHPDTSLTMKKSIIKKYKHDGVFQYNESLHKEIWSCCMGESKNSQGCIVSYKDLDKWQTISF